MEMGIRSFILSGYPNIDECNRFAELVLPRLKTFSMPQEQGRVIKNPPQTPLADGIRV
jgi:alkanesulfonate monooxygenase